MRVARGLTAIRGNEWVAGIVQGLNVVKVSVASFFANDLDIILKDLFLKELGKFVLLFFFNFFCAAMRTAN